MSHQQHLKSERLNYLLWEIKSHKHNKRHIYNQELQAGVPNWHVFVNEVHIPEHDLPREDRKGERACRYKYQKHITENVKTQNLPLATDQGVVFFPHKQLLTNVYVSIFVESIDDKGEEKPDVARVVVCQIYNPSTGQNRGCERKIVTLGSYLATVFFFLIKLIYVSCI